MEGEEKGEEEFFLEIWGLGEWGNNMVVLEGKREEKEREKKKVMIRIKQNKMK